MAEHIRGRGDGSRITYNDGEVRLTAENCTVDMVNKIVDQTAGLLGMYEIKEYQNLMGEFDNQGIKDFILQWTESKLDNKAGTLKLRPNSEDGRRRLERARARPIRKRNPGLSMYHAVGFVQETKRHREANFPRVQDFMIRKHSDPSLQPFIESGDVEGFKKYISTHMRDDFRNNELETMFELLPKVKEVMAREIPIRKDTEDMKSEVKKDEMSTKEAQEEAAWQEAPSKSGNDSIEEGDKESPDEEVKDAEEPTA